MQRVIRTRMPRGLHSSFFACPNGRPASSSYPCFITGSRAYAAHRGSVTSSSLLSQALDQKQRASRRNDSVGPFQLGLIPPTPEEVGEFKKWKDLSTSGKVMRSTARTTNFAVILFGAGFTAMLIYALTSELFSKNSPTVLYGEACDLIKNSPRVAKYLQGPLAFHNNPPTSIRPKHRNRHLSSQIAVDSSGREHMLLNFYVQGKPPGSSPQTTSRLDSVVEWTQQTASNLSEMTVDDLFDSVKERSERALGAFKSLFRFLSGEEPVTPPQVPIIPSTEEREARNKSWTSNFTGLFSGLKGASHRSHDSSNDPPAGISYTEGEVHADLVMNDEGYYELRYLLIDMPDSNARNPKRVFVVRTEGVRESESVMRWRR